MYAAWGIARFEMLGFFRGGLYQRQVQFLAFQQSEERHANSKQHGDRDQFSVNWNCCFCNLQKSEPFSHNRVGSRSTLMVLSIRHLLEAVEVSLLVTGREVSRVLAPFLAMVFQYQ